MWHPWRALAERVARKDLLEAASLDEVYEYQRAIERAVGVAPMLPAQPSKGDGPPPNAPLWQRQAAWPSNHPARARLEGARDNRRRW
jgi:hypothetical protein